MAAEAAQNTLAPPPETSPSAGEESNLRRFVQAVAHAVRNPLVSIRTFSELLPENYDDPDFRDRFRELVGQDVARIDAAITRLQGIVDLPDIEPQPVDLAHLLDKLLDEHAEEIRARKLLILKELDHSLPHAYGDPMLLRDVFAGLLERALRDVKDRGDIYIASKHHESGRGGEPSVRILLRYSEAGAPGSSDANRALSGDENLEGILAQTIIQSLGGSFTRDTTEADECVVVIDLPAPGPE
jgi:signal transduction histidine kinase